MQILFKATLFAVASSLCCAAQIPAIQEAASPSPPLVKVFAGNEDVSSASLQPSEYSLANEHDCTKRLQGKVSFSIIVDTTGQGRHIYFLRPLGTVLDYLALDIALHDRFLPGQKDGQAIAVAHELEVDLKACAIEKVDTTGNKSYALGLLEEPKQKLAPAPEQMANLAPDDKAIYKANTSGLTLPVLEKSVEAVFTDEARKMHVEGACLLSVIVDEHGIPKSIKVVHPLGHGLDENAINALRGYRFKPAMKAGAPVSFSLMVQINFKFLDRPRI